MQEEYKTCWVLCFMQFCSKYVVFLDDGGESWTELDFSEWKIKTLTEVD